MSADERPRGAWADLVAGLLDTRADPVTARFDEELAAAVAAGSVSEAAAHSLRFWQRASIRAVTDHVRTVVPTALDALDASRADAERYVREAAAVLAEAAEPLEEAEGPAPEPGSEPAPGPPPATQTPAPPAEDGRMPTGEPAPADPAEHRRASTQQPGQPSSLEAPTRLIVADLTLAEHRTGHAS